MLKAEQHISSSWINLPKDIQIINPED